MDRVVIPHPPDCARDGVGAAHARRVYMTIAGMRGVACASRVEQALAASEGVLSVAVDLAAGRARVGLGRDCTEDDDALAARLEAAVEASGYAASTIAPEAAEANAARRGDRLDLILACALTAPLLVSMLLHLLFVLLHQDRLAWAAALPGWIQFLLATPVQFWFGRTVYRAAWASLRDRASAVALLAALGSSAAWGSSTVTLLAGSQNQTFAISAVIITSLLAGAWLERQGRGHAAQTVRSLLDLLPKTAIRRDALSLAEQEVLLGELRVRDLIVVGPGVRVPIDGIVREGESSLSEPLSAGENSAMARRGEPVMAGSLAIDGTLVIEALAIGAETRLATVLRRIGETPVTHPQRLADLLSAIVAAAALLVALLTLIGWWAASGNGLRALSDAVSVLVIACPCALGLAAPAALAAGTAAAARAGIVFRNVGAIERARGIGLVAFGQTGILTDGHASIEHVLPAGGSGHYAEAAELLSLAASMQDGSDHPLAAAVRASSGHAVTGAAERVRVVPGCGVTGRVGGRSLLLGSRRMIEGEGFRLPAPLAEAAERVDAEGGTVSLLAERRSYEAGGDRILGLLGFTEQATPAAAMACARLAQGGMTSVLLSSDGEGAARRIAASAGMDRLLSGLSPKEKADSVLALVREASGSERPRVAMVGDDAPALAASDLGIALGAGSEAAIQAATIVVLNRVPDPVVDAIEVAGLTATHVRKGLFWAFLFNAIGIPIAAAGLLSPALAAGAAVLGGVGVAINALRLSGWRPHDIARTDA